jgi:hypothetical protein
VLQPQKWIPTLFWTRKEQEVSKTKLQELTTKSKQVPHAWCTASSDVLEYKHFKSHSHQLQNNLIKNKKRNLGYK